MSADSVCRSVSAPNKVCGVLWGFCRIYKQFLVVELVEALASSLFLFCTQTESTPATVPLTQSVAGSIFLNPVSAQ